MKTVELMSAKNNFEAEIVKGLLKTEGINCALVGANSPYLGAGLPGLDVRILVNDEDLERAKEILSNRKNIEENNPEQLSDKELEKLALGEQ